MIERFLTYLRAEKRYSENTLEAYERDIAQFLEFLGTADSSDAASTGYAARVNVSVGDRGVSARAETSISTEAATTSARNGTSVPDNVAACDSALVPFDPATVTTDDIRQWIVALSSQGLSANSINRKTSSLRSLYRYLRKTSVVTHDPFRGIGSRKTPSRLPGFVPQNKMSEVTDMVDEDMLSDDFTVRRNALLVLLFYTMGLRISELCGIKLGDFSQGYSQLKVRGKGNKERMVPVMDYTMREIDQFVSKFSAENILISPEISLFLTEEGKPLSRSSVYKIVTNELGKAGVQGKKNPHLLRHTFATHMMDGGADIRTIQEILGHKSLATTQVYTHNSIARLKEAYRKAHPRSRQAEKRNVQNSDRQRDGLDDSYKEE